MHGLRIMVALSLITIAGAALAGCEREGPAERAGKAVDEAVEDAGDAAEDAGDKVKDAVN